MGYQLIITEKPAAANKIANALAEGKAVKKNIDKVPYYELKHGSKQIVVASAVGHLFGLAEKEKTRKYPVFDIEWVESNKINSASKFTKKYVNVLKKLSKHAEDFVVATDYDVEGEVIGINVIKYICKKKDAKRMKFSTLTKPDLVKSYETMQDSINWGQANAGLTRHEMDWYYGINLSRALTASIKSAGMFKLLSVGRVQGPALKIVVDREKEIQAFKPVPYWEIRLDGSVHSTDIEAWHKEDKFWDKAKADEVMEKTKGHDGKVSEIKKRAMTQNAPFPFDLTSMQIEAYKLFKYTPKRTLEIAQELYTAGFISYPRTSSQQLPPEIGYNKILTDLKRNSSYTLLADELLKKGSLKPNNGKKTDPAHPAIYPTGIKPDALGGEQFKIYDLIVKRFFATFADAAKRETVEIHIDVNAEIFIAKGTRTVYEGWHRFYHPYVKLEEQEMPACADGDSVDVRKIEQLAKETQPPKRYTQASLIKELEKRGLGTKATRASIIETLYNRNYIEGKQVKATEMGIQTEDMLEKYSPRIVDQELTRHFEEDMDAIYDNKKKPEQILEEAKKIVTEMVGSFKEKEKEIGKELLDANKKAEEEINTIGKCPKCDGGNLVIRSGRYGPFVACTNYPDCKNTYKLIKGKKAYPAKKDCEECGLPMVAMYQNRKRQNFCINPDCPSKQSEETAEEKKNEGKVCPKCGKGKLVMRKSIYGSFLACDQYPKCRYIDQSSQEKNDPYL